MVQHAAEKLVTPDCMTCFIPLHGCLASKAVALVCITQSIGAAVLVSCFHLIHFDVVIAYCMHAAVVSLTWVHIESSCLSDLTIVLAHPFGGSCSQTLHSECQHGHQQRGHRGDRYVWPLLRKVPCEAAVTQCIFSTRGTLDPLPLPTLSTTPC